MLRGLEAASRNQRETHAKHHLDLAKFFYMKSNINKPYMLILFIFYKKQTNKEDNDTVLIDIISINLFFLIPLIFHIYIYFKSIYFDFMQL